MNKLKILTTILIVLMAASPAYAAQCNQIQQQPGSVTDAPDLTALPANTEAATWTDYTGASTETTTLTTASIAPISGCSDNAPNVEVGGIFTYSNENNYAGPAVALNTVYNTVSNNYITTYQQPSANGLAILSTDLSGTQTANTGFTDVTIPGAILNPKGMAINQISGDIFVLFSDKATVTSSFLASFTEDGLGGYAQNWNMGIYKTIGVESIYPHTVSNVNTVDDRIYTISSIGQPATDAVISAFDTSTGEFTSSIVTTALATTSVEDANILYNNGKVYATVVIGGDLYVMAITLDGTGDLAAANIDYSFKFTNVDTCAIWQNTKNLVLTSDGTLVTDANCLTAGGDEKATWLAFTASTGNKNWYLTTNGRIGGLFNEGDEIGLGYKKAPSNYAGVFTSGGTKKWHKQLDTAVTTINDVGFGSLPAPTSLSFMTVSASCNGGYNGCTYWLNWNSGFVLVGFSLAQPTLSTNDKTPNGINVITNAEDSKCCFVTLDGGVSTMNVCDVHNAYPDPAPEFSLTTLLLATLLAGGLVLFVVRRKYK